MCGIRGDKEVGPALSELFANYVAEKGGEADPAARSVRSACSSGYNANSNDFSKVATAVRSGPPRYAKRPFLKRFGLFFCFL